MNKYEVTKIGDGKESRFYDLKNNKKTWCSVHHKTPPNRAKIGVFIVLFNILV